MRITIRAEEGMWLTDGENYGKTMDLGAGVTADKFYEITDAEYQEILKAQEEEMDNPIE